MPASMIDQTADRSNFPSVAGMRGKKHRGSPCARHAENAGADLSLLVHQCPQAIEVDLMLCGVLQESAGVAGVGTRCRLHQAGHGRVQKPALRSNKRSTGNFGVEPAGRRQLIWLGVRRGHQRKTLTGEVGPLE
jgi:hypothetical protein